VLEWQYIDGLSVQEIADREGQTLIAVQSAGARARALLGMLAPNPRI
jgi:DNA-directed RNA polymerase specialized sigma24 family protein